MRQIRIDFKHNGYLVTTSGLLKNNGEYVYKATEEIKLLEALGLALLEKKIEVKEK